MSFVKKKRVYDCRLIFACVNVKKTYYKIDKRGAFYIEWFEDKHTKDLTHALSSAKALDSFVEIYVVGKDFKWTYIKTHENDMCGPYFMMNNKKQGTSVFRKEG